MRSHHDIFVELSEFPPSDYCFFISGGPNQAQIKEIPFPVDAQNEVQPWMMGLDGIGSIDCIGSIPVLP